MSTRCLSDRIRCLPDVHQIISDVCLSEVCQIISDVFQMSTRSLPDVYQMSIRCLPDVYQMSPDVNLPGSPGKAKRIRYVH